MLFFACPARVCVCCNSMFYRGICTFGMACVLPILSLPVGDES